MPKPVRLEQLIQCGLDPATAQSLLQPLNHSLITLPPPECWQHLTRQVLQPSHPFTLHQWLHGWVFAESDSRNGPAPAWFPSPDQSQATHLAELMRELNLSSYAELHAWSTHERTAFWERLVQQLGIRFRQPYTAIADVSNLESPQWFVNAQLNIADSCFQAPGTATAIVTQSETAPLTTWTYSELNALSNQVANGLVAMGLRAGDAIAIAMPMTAEAVAIYLGIVKAGGVVVSIADSFAASEIATRLSIAHTKAIFTQDSVQRCGKLLPLYSKVIEAQAPTAIVRLSHPEAAIALRDGDLTWEQFLSPDSDFTAVACSPAAPTNILFSSGTTGTPKAIPWSHTTPIKCAVDAYLHHDIHPGDVLAWPTNLGWMMGPWLIYASLINQAAIALYDGAPTTREFGEFIQTAQVTMLGVVPSLVSHWKTTHCMQGLNWSRIKAFSSTGECSNPQDMLFLMALAGYKPVIEYCGGTEIGGAYLTGTLIQPAIPATFTTPALGLDIVILDEHNQSASSGEALIVPPSIGLSTELLNADHHQVYFANTPTLLQHHTYYHLRRHGDRVERLPNGYYRAQGRVDDTMNLGGIKVSAAEIERCLMTVEGVHDVAAIATSPGGPSQLVIYAVVDPVHSSQPDRLKTNLQAAIRNSLNPLFKIHDLIVVNNLPRTASNKVMRRILRAQYPAN